MAAEQKKSRLGKGLGALLGEYLPEDAGPEASGYRVVQLSRIVANPLQPRRNFTDEQLSELETSIRENGLLQPLVVRPTTGNGTGPEYELVAGERRWRALRRLGWAEVPVIVREMDDRTLLVLAIVENVQRADLSPLEEAEGYRRLIEEFGYTQKDVAEQVGKERSTVTNLLRLLQLPATVQRMVTAGQLSMGHARAILGLNDERRMAELARRAIGEGLSVRAVEEQVRRQRSAAAAKSGETPATDVPAPSGDPHVRAMERDLQRRFGTPVRIHAGRGRSGRIEIPFYNEVDFERVMELLLDPAAEEV